MVSTYCTNPAMINMFNSIISTIAHQPNNNNDSLFWQFPCRTEAEAFEVHNKMPSQTINQEKHFYLRLPWATLIDRQTKPKSHCTIAMGSIPVLMGVMPALPNEGISENIDWDSIVIRIKDEDIPFLLDILRKISLKEQRKCQFLAIQAYKRVKEQRCF